MPPRRERALQVLAQTGMNKANYAPPLFRLLWRLRADCPPPHFLPFWQAAALAGVFFALAWAALIGLFGQILSWPRPHGLALPLIALLVGALFGLAMALYYAYGRRKHRLPQWETLLPSR